jgi:hypothetical protein
VIFVDSNLFVIDLRYRDDVAYPINRRALDRLARQGVGVTSVLNLLEVCGILSFNLSPQSLHDLYRHFARRFQVAVLPADEDDTRLPAPTAGEVLARMEKRMALKDAEIALAVEQQAATLTAFVSWNAKHFVGKLPIPALTPSQWMAKRARIRQR